MLRIIFVPYVLAEILLIAFFIGSYGFLAYLLEIILSAMLGGVLLFKFNISNVFNQLNTFSPKAIYSGFGVAIGAFLLLLPGILSDITAVIIIIASVVFNVKDNKRDKFNQNTYNNTQNNTNNKEEIIDVEIIEEEKR